METNEGNYVDKQGKQELNTGRENRNNGTENNFKIRVHMTTDKHRHRARYTYSA